MYFADRPAAGRLLADKLAHYADQPCAVLSLSAGGVLVGAQIAMRLHCHLMLLMTERIILPGEHEAIGALTTDSFSYSDKLSESEIDYINGEFHNVIDTQRMTKHHALNRLLTAETKITPNDLRDKVVVIVSDGFTDTLALDVVEDFIKPIRIKRLVVAVPITSVKALDKIHLLADELAILDVREDIISVDHHYDKNIIPDYDGLVKIIRNTA
jgi:predicted phosphoribosyltransferase